MEQQIIIFSDALSSVRDGCELQAKAEDFAKMFLDYCSDLLT